MSSPLPWKGGGVRGSATSTRCRGGWGGYHGREDLGRALEEELHPRPLAPVSATEATPLERQVAAALGVDGEPYWPRLPLEVGCCEQGGRCCWRWLARAALEQVAGMSMGQHEALADMIAALRTDLSELAELRELQKAANVELTQAAFEKQQQEKLQFTHASLEKDLCAASARLEELDEVRSERDALRKEVTQLRISEEQLRQHSTSLEIEHRKVVEGDLAAARHRALEAEKEIAKVSRSRLDQQAANVDLNQQIENIRRELAAKMKENDELRQEWQKSAAIALRYRGKKKYMGVRPKYGY